MLSPDHFMFAWDRYPRLPYHNYDHALEVMSMVRVLVDTYEVTMGRGLSDDFDFVDIDALDAAALFHDIVYVPGANDNESVSAALAEQTLAEPPLTGSAWARHRTARVAELILYTKGHQPPATDVEGSILCAADLWGFTRGYDVFTGNNARIDEEFLVHGGVDPVAYGVGRKAFLEGFLERAEAGTLFRIPWFVGDVNGAAAANLRRALIDFT